MASSPSLSCGEHFNKVGATLTGELLSWPLQEKEHDCSEVILNVLLSQYRKLATFVAAILPRLFHYVFYILFVYLGMRYF